MQNARFGQGFADQPDHAAIGGQLVDNHGAAAAHVPQHRKIGLADAQQGRLIQRTLRKRHFVNREPRQGFQLARAMDLRMRRQDLLQQGRAGAHHADDEDRQRPGRMCGVQRRPGLWREAGGQVRQKRAVLIDMVADLTRPQVIAGFQMRKASIHVANAFISLGQAEMQRHLFLKIQRLIARQSRHGRNQRIIRAEILGTAEVEETDGGPGGKLQRGFKRGNRLGDPALGQEHVPKPAMHGGRIWRLLQDGAQQGFRLIQAIELNQAGRLAKYGRPVGRDQGQVAGKAFHGLTIPPQLSQKARLQQKGGRQAGRLLKDSLDGRKRLLHLSGGVEGIGKVHPGLQELRVQLQRKAQVPHGGRIELCFQKRPAQDPLRPGVARVQPHGCRHFLDRGRQAGGGAQLPEMGHLRRRERARRQAGGRSLHLGQLCQQARVVGEFLQHLQQRHPRGGGATCL